MFAIILIIAEIYILILCDTVYGIVSVSTTLPH